MVIDFNFIELQKMLSCFVCTSALQKDLIDLLPLTFHLAQTKVVSLVNYHNWVLKYSPKRQKYLFFRTVLR